MSLPQASAILSLVSVSVIPLEELAPVIAGRPYLAELWQLLCEGRSDLTPEQAVELAFAEIRAFEQRGDMAAMLKRGEAALALALQAGYRAGVAYAYFMMAYCQLQLGNYDRAGELARASLACDERTLYTGSGWRVLALCAQNTNDWAGAQRYFERGLRAVRETGWRPGLIAILAHIGLFSRDRGLFELALSTLTEAEALAGDETSNWHWVVAPYLVGIYLQTGRRAEARLALDKARISSTSSRYVELNFRAFAARLMLDEDDHAGAEESLQQAKALAEAQGMADMLLQIRLDFSRLRRLQGDAPGALVWANDALAFARSLKGRFDEGNALIARARAWWQLEDAAAAEMDLLAALHIATLLGADYLAAESTFLLAVLQREQNRAEAESTWLDAAHRIRTGGYSFLLERERALAFPLVAASARSRSAEVRRSAEALLEQLVRVAPLPLHVRGLGTFEVRQGRRLIAEREWRQRKAGELFRFLLLQPKRTVLRERVFEALWPGQSPQAAQRLFHLATSTLRRILEPDLPDKFPSRYLSVVGERVSLYLPSGSSLDFECFESGMVACLAAPRGTAQATGTGGAGELEVRGAAQAELQRLFTLYADDLFPMDRYVEWAQGARARMAELVMRGLLVLAEHQLALGRPQQALDTCRQALARDPWREDAVITGMRACLLLNDRPAAMRLYLTLEQTLRDELRLAPRADLASLARTITAS